MSEDRFWKTVEDRAEHFFLGYFRDPNPEYAVAGLAQAVRTTEPGGSQNALMMCVRAAQIYADVAAAYRDLAEQLPEGADIINQVLAAAADPNAPDPATCAIQYPADLDFLWSEFLLTGAAAPVERIAAVLAWEDRILQALTGWLKQTAWTPWGRTARAKTIVHLREAGFELELGQPRLGNRFDLDLLTWSQMAGGFQLKESMPFEVTDALVMNMALKGAACWSLQSNALQHDVPGAIYAALPDRDRLPQFVSPDDH